MAICAVLGRHRTLFGAFKIAFKQLTLVEWLVRCDSQQKFYLHVLTQLNDLMGGNAKGGFYAVARGKTVGIFQTWAECHRQVDGFSNARFKKFSTKKEAETFINENRSPIDTNLPDMVPLGRSSGSKATNFNGWMTFNTTSISWRHSSSSSTRWEDIGKGSDLPNPDDFKPKPRKVNESKRQAYKNDLISAKPNPSAISVYTDGACEANGRHGAKGGIGVYWGPNHKMNISERLEGRQTNNRAEIQAAVKAVQQARNLGLKEINLHTDSQFMIKSMTMWIRKWKKNDWKLVNNEPVKNKEDFIQLDNASQGIKVNWVYVPGHRGIGGNEAADQLARAGVCKNIK